MRSSVGAGLSKRNIEIEQTLSLATTKFSFQKMKSYSKWRKIENTMKFINLSKKAAKKTYEDLEFEKIKRNNKKWVMLKNSIKFLTILRSVSTEISEEQVPLPLLDFHIIHINRFSYYTYY